MRLRAVVIGTGWAGEGHTLALRAAGADVIALCGRTPEPAKAMAVNLGVPDVRFDWREALEELRPDIVAIATPAAPHREMAEYAAQLGCHILCDKPLGVTAIEAAAMLTAVEQAKVKHAYAASSCYDAHYEFARELILDNLIGRVREIESVLHINDSPLLPYTWFHRLELGGGMLNNVLTHRLSQICRITNGKITAAAGETNRLIEYAPVGPPIHDFRTSFQPLAPEEILEWREVTADLAYTVMLQVKLPDGTTISVLCKASAMGQARHDDYLAFYGDKGTLHLSGPWLHTHIEHFDNAKGVWQTLSIPQRIIEALPQAENHVQRDWNQLCREFVTDVRGDGETTYPTFRDGWIHNQVIDIARNGRGWTPVAAHLIDD